MTDSDTETGGTEQFAGGAHLRDRAEVERDLYERHGRPSRPYYLKCLRCEECWEVDGMLRDAIQHDSAFHAGYHGGLKEEHAEVVVTDAGGRELHRRHAIFKPEQEPEGCPNCGDPGDDDRIACPNCGHIPEDHRLMPDDGLRCDGGTPADGVDHHRKSGVIESPVDAWALVEWFGDVFLDETKDRFGQGMHVEVRIDVRDVNGDTEDAGVERSE